MVSGDENRSDENRGDENRGDENRGDENRDDPNGRTGGDDAPFASAARWGGPEPCCALCAGPGAGDVAEYHLTHGVSLMLCRQHRSAANDSTAAEVFADELAALWNASGCMTARRRAALTAHPGRVRRWPTPIRPQPGSYSWPGLRVSAEQRFARGEDPNLVIHQLRAQVAGGEATAPSIRTMRRWYCESRWLDTPPSMHDRTEATEGAIAQPRHAWLAWSERIMPLDQIPRLLWSPAAPFNLDYHGLPRGTPKQRRRR
jgi:hypothetical protein